MVCAPPLFVLLLLLAPRISGTASRWVWFSDTTRYTWTPQVSQQHHHHHHHHHRDSWTPGPRSTTALLLIGFCCQISASAACLLGPGLFPAAFLPNRMW